MTPIAEIIVLVIILALYYFLLKAEKDVKRLNDALNKTIGVLVKKDLKIAQLEYGIKARNIVLMNEAIEDLLEEEEYDEAHKLQVIQGKLIQEL